MNYLAHLALSYFSADLQAGNFLGDVLRGREVDALPAGIRRGVELHRAIDRLTDAHAEVRKTNRILSLRHGRYAPVISDIAFDYFLCRNWSTLMPLPFNAFRKATYGNLLAARKHMPPRAVRYVEGMTADDWLQLYATPRGMQQVFRRLLPRLSRPALLDGVNDTLEEHTPVLNRTLLHLFPALQALAETYREPTQPPETH